MGCYYSHFNWSPAATGNLIKVPSQLFQYLISTQLRGTKKDGFYCNMQLPTAGHIVNHCSLFTAAWIQFHRDVQAYDGRTVHSVQEIHQGKWRIVLPTVEVFHKNLAELLGGSFVFACGWKNVLPALWWSSQVGHLKTLQMSVGKNVVLSETGTPDSRSMYEHQLELRRGSPGR